MLVFRKPTMGIRAVVVVLTMELLCTKELLLLPSTVVLLLLPPMRDQPSAITTGSLLLLLLRQHLLDTVVCHRRCLLRLQLSWDMHTLHLPCLHHSLLPALLHILRLLLTAAGPVVLPCRHLPVSLLSPPPVKLP
jgi:hypothetical protein